MSPRQAASAKLAGCGFWAFLALGVLCMVSKFVDFSPGPRASLVNILLDYLPATGLYLLHVRWPLVKEGGDVGVLTVLGVILVYGGPACLLFRLARRARENDGSAFEE